ncbi:MAG TPA: hypothetical protein VF763_08010 [Candidatus Limnocylindrales bacterium]
MCELFVARAAQPFRIAELWPLAERLERYGIAGFGWGAAWVRADGSLGSHRDTGAFREDAAGRAAVGGEETTSLLVHLRRPSRLSTLGVPDTQPFVDPAGRFAFAHNGDLRHFRPFRERYRAAGRIHGRADSEVAARWLEDEWGHGEPGLLLAALHDAMGGQANLALIEPDGALAFYAGNQENPVFRFRLPGVGERVDDGIEVVASGIYSLDRSFFRYVAPAALERRAVAYRTAAVLGPAATASLS